MIYRKAPRQPARLLLSVVAAGAGVALVAACSSDFQGSVYMPEPDASSDGSRADGDISEASVDDVVVGVSPCPDAACGVMSNPDAGDAGTDADAAGGGVVPNPDSGPIGVVDSGGDQ